MKRQFAVVFLLGAFVLSSLEGEGHSRTWRVNVIGTGDAPTIQAAIDSSSAGDTILIAPGSYLGPVSAYIESKSHLTLLSEVGPQSTVLYGFGVNLSSYITAMGFTFSDAEYGVALAFSDHIRIENSIVARVQKIGLLADATGGVVIKNNLFHSCPIGIWMVDASDAIDISANTVLQCGQWGIYTDGVDVTIARNIVAWNDVGVSGNAPLLLCNDIYGNRVNYDLLFGGDPTGVNGNISVDAEFCAVDPAGTGNFLLQSDSPCAPGNHPNGYSCGLIGQCPVGCQAEAIREASWGFIKSLYR